MKVSYRLAKFSGNRQCRSEDILSLVCHVILKDHAIKESWTL